MSVHKNKQNNTWYVKYQNKTKRGFKTKFEAQQYEAKLKLSIINLNHCMKFNDIAIDYLEYLENNTSHGTYIKFKNILYNVILPNTQNLDISKIKELDCRKFYDYVNNLDYSTTYKNYIILKYKAIFKHAMKYFRLSHDPTYIISPFKKSFDEKMKQKEKELNVWTIDEFNKFYNEINKDIYKELFFLLYFTGLRLGEALALQWKDIDSSSIHVIKSITRKTTKGTYEVKEPKNSSSIRDIQLGKTLKDYMLCYKEREMKISGFSDDWFVFGRISPLPQTSIDRVKDKAIERANVRRIRIHDFRHSHASNLIANGINIVAVSKRLGHSDVSMTLKVYTHLMKKSEDELLLYIDNSSQNILK